MTKDDILQALRLTAMGRAGHPLQEQLAEKLSLLFEGRDWEPLCHCPSHAAPQVPDGAAALTKQPVPMDDCGRLEEVGDSQPVKVEIVKPKRAKKDQAGDNKALLDAVGAK